MLSVLRIGKKHSTMLDIEVEVLVARVEKEVLDDGEIVEAVLATTTALGRWEHSWREKMITVIRRWHYSAVYR